MNIEYYVVNTAQKGKNKEDFLNWAIENKLYRNIDDEPDLKPTYLSGMKNIFEQNKETKDLTAIIALKEGKPIGMLLCVNDFYKREIEFNLFGRKNSAKKFPDVEAICLGNVMFYIKPDYRKNGIAGKLLNILEIEKAKILIANKERETSLMFFKAREKAIEIIRKFSKYSYPVYDKYQMHYDKYGIMLYERKYQTSLMENSEVFKSEPTIDDIENIKIKKISISALLNFQDKKYNKETNTKGLK